MSLKRKRSFSDFSPESNASSSASRDSLSPTPQQHGWFRATPAPATGFGALSTHLKPTTCANSSGRTMKRYRDNRESEQIVYENTINKLFEAQRLNPHSIPIQSEGVEEQPEDSEMEESEPEPLPLPPQRSNLHDFWNAFASNNVPAKSGTRRDVENDTGTASDAMDVDLDNH
ncbi:MAG: hypothetical protein M1820_003782 [Bogoriella megaspora]|nr:MAG: hypothetical protein M1820_003782 [Bogoriella megaspora]